MCVFRIADTPAHLLSELFLLSLLHPFPALFIISLFTLPFGEEGHLLSFTSLVAQTVKRLPTRRETWV